MDGQVEFKGMSKETNGRTVVYQVGQDNHGAAITDVITDADRQGHGDRSFTRTTSTSEHQLKIALTFRGVNASVAIPGKKGPGPCCGGEGGWTKQILKDVTGVVQPGSLLAIMGASGAGKSTLLNVLTARNLKGYLVTGDIRLNGWNVGQGIRHVSAYVQQDDIFFDNLTVREQLQFRALLRMDTRLDRTHRLSRVEEVIQEMGLTKCADSRIGAAGGREKGISGGERKRLSFASEALTNPPIFFCDEPTSGLDTFMAQSIVGTLQRMAERGRTILCTIHQPSSEIFGMFNQILLLAEGETAYMGPPADCMTFFEKQGYPCPSLFNPADHYILTLAIVPGKEAKCKDKTKAICSSFREDAGCAAIAGQIDSLMERARTSGHDPLLDEASAGESRYESGWLTQMRMLFWRSWINTFRDVILFRVRVMQACILSLVLGLVYLQIDIDQKGVQDINGAIFLLITNTTFSNMFAVINSFPIELGIFMREYGSGLYRVDTYYLCKTLAEMPLFIMISIIFTTICYWMMGLYNDIETYLVAVGVLLLVANVTVSLGYFLSAAAGSVQVALSIAPPLLIPFLLFGGLFVNADNIPVYFIWMQYLSWFKYANEVLLINQWENIDDIPCNATSPIGCNYLNGNDVLNALSMKTENYWLDIGVLFALIVGFRVLSFLVLFVKARRSKG